MNTDPTRVWLKVTDSNGHFPISTREGETRAGCNLRSCSEAGRKSGCIQDSQDCDLDSTCLDITIRRLLLDVGQGGSRSDSKVCVRDESPLASSPHLCRQDLSSTFRVQSFPVKMYCVATVTSSSLLRVGCYLMWGPRCEVFEWETVCDLQCLRRRRPLGVATQSAHPCIS